MKNLSKLNDQEHAALMDASLQSIDPNIIDFEERGRQKLRMSVFQILQQCTGRDRDERLMTDEAYFVNSIGQLLIVLFDAEHDPFVVLPFESNEYFRIQRAISIQ